MNKIILIGNLTRDPELRTTASGVSVCSFGIAVQRRGKIPDGQPDVDFFNISAWRQLGENCQKYLQKGRKVYVSGPLQLRTYDANDGTKRTVAEVTADDVEFLSSPQQGSGDSPAYSAPRADAPRNAPPSESGFTQVDDDELPF